MEQGEKMSINNEETETMQPKMQILKDFGSKRTPYGVASGGVIYLDTSDINCVARYSEKLDDIDDVYETYKKLEAQVISLQNETGGIKEDISKQEIQKCTSYMLELDVKMKAIIDYIFDSDICSVAFGNASILSPQDGRIKYEVVIDRLFGLFDDAIAQEAKRSRRRQQNAIDKYKGHPANRTGKK